MSNVSPYLGSKVTGSLIDNNAQVREQWGVAWGLPYASYQFQAGKNQSPRTFVRYNWATTTQGNLGPTTS